MQSNCSVQVEESWGWGQRCGNVVTVCLKPVVIKIYRCFPVSCLFLSFSVQKNCGYVGHCSTCTVCNSYLSWGPWKYIGLWILSYVAFSQQHSSVLFCVTALLGDCLRHARL